MYDKHIYSLTWGGKVVATAVATAAACAKATQIYVFGGKETFAGTRPLLKLEMVIAWKKLTSVWLLR